MYEPTKLAIRIKKTAKERGISLNDLFLECGINKNAMAGLKAGKEMSSISLARIADRLDCSVDYLLGRTDVIFTAKETPPALAEGMKRSQITVPDDGLPTTREALEQFVRSVLEKQQGECQDGRSKG